MPKRTGIDLLVPGLLGPIPVLQEIDILPKVPVIEGCLSKADVSRIDAVDYAATLFHLFDLNATEYCDLPTAPFCRLADGARKDGGYWLQAAPVHLRPDGDGLLLFDAGVLGITRDEAQLLAAMVRKHFGWQLEVHDPQRWYLMLEDQPDLQTSPLSDVIGRNIDSFLPTGKDAMTWHALMNEVQMLLHMSQVNLLREGRGLLPINGLWLHGGGSHRVIEQTVYTSVSADEPLARGMSLAAGVEPTALPQDSAELAPENGQHLVVYDRLERSVLDADPYGWVESVEELDSWLGPLLGAVRSNRIGYIDIYPCNGHVYRISARSLRRFWRRRKALGHYISG